MIVGKPNIASKHLDIARTDTNFPSKHLNIASKDMNFLKKPPSGEPKEGFKSIYFEGYLRSITSFRPCRHPFHRPLVA
jgi:hypothetical protein